MASKKLMAAAALTLGLLNHAAHAAVTYDFTALSWIPFPGDAESLTGSFSVTVPKFITSDTTLPVSALGNCSVVASGGPATCTGEQFLFDMIKGQATVAFGVDDVNERQIAVFYYFDAASTGKDGTYASDILGAAQAGTLTVSGIPAVPEPASPALMLAGLGALALAVRRQAR